MQEDIEETELFQYNYDAIGMEKANSYPTFIFTVLNSAWRLQLKKGITKLRAKIKADPKLYQAQLLKDKIKEKQCQKSNYRNIY